MNGELPILYLARHGETAWSLSGQHTGRTDLPLTPNGERNARLLGERLRDLKLAAVYTSPLQRAARTCELAGFSDASIDPNLVEWDYGEFEGLTSAEILARKSDWDIYRDGCPGGESPDQVADRADSVIQRVRGISGNVLVFSSGHFLRVLAMRWLRYAPGTAGNYFLLNTASVSALGYDRNVSRPVVRLWNDDRHLTPL